MHPEPSRPLYFANLLRSCSTLGPGRRVALWVARCSRGCPGCVAEPIIGPLAGRPIEVTRLADRILGWPEANALTLSGGEPFEQAEAVLELCTLLRAERDFSLMAYSGFTRAALARAPESAEAKLLEMLDILVDGPYVEGLAGDFLWKGSANQTIHILSDRHEDLKAKLNTASVGVEFQLTPEGRFFWAGIPTPGLDVKLREGLKELGISLQDESIGGFDERLTEI